MWKKIGNNVNKVGVEEGQNTNMTPGLKNTQSNPQLKHEGLVKKTASSLLQNTFTHIHTPNSNKFYI